MLSSREVEGNGPTKPGNPLATMQEGCQFRRSNPQDEGNERTRRQTPEYPGVFCCTTHCISYNSS